MTDATAAVRPCDCGKVVPEDQHHCWVHHAKEAEPDEAVYIVCGECFHVYRTGADLEAAYEREKPYGCPEQRAAEIYFCQECLHDF